MRSCLHLPHNDDISFFSGMVDRRNALSLIFNRDHCQGISPSQFSDMSRSGCEPVQNLASGLVKFMCVSDNRYTTAPLWAHHLLTHIYSFRRNFFIFHVFLLFLISFDIFIGISQYFKIIPTQLMILPDCGRMKG